MFSFLRARVDLFIIIALVLALQTSMVTEQAWLSYADIPISMIRVYFHEMGHGIAALLSGGHFYQIELAFGQGGLAHTDGTRMFGDEVTLFGGYMAPSIWGLLIYTAFARWLSDRIEWVPYICMGIAGASILLWARDIRTIGIVVFVMAVFQSIGRLDSDKQMYWAVKFLSVYLIIGGGLDPYLFYAYPEYDSPALLQVWDGRGLADLTNHKEIFWVHCWMGISAVSFTIFLVMEFLAGEMVFGDGV